MIGNKPVLQGQDLRRFVLEIGLHFSNIVFVQGRSVFESNDSEAVHDMRVASRRLRQALTLFKDYYPSLSRKRISKKVRSLTRILALPREMDVNAQLLRSFGLNGGLVLQTTHEHLLSWCEREQNRLRCRMLKALKKLDLCQLDSDIRRWGHVGRGHPREESNGNSGPPLATFLSQLPVLLAAKASPVLAFRPAAPSLESDEALHQLRISTKKLRYALELIKPLLPEGEISPPIDRCRSLQELLGKIHDAAALIQLIQQHQRWLDERKLVLLSHGCGRIVGEFQESKQRLVSEVTGAHESLVSELSTFLDSSKFPEPSQTSSVLSETAKNA